jgi:lipoprotein-anchoring transpeptidase ErfK/SrfK
MPARKVLSTRTTAAVGALALSVALAACDGSGSAKDDPRTVDRFAANRADPPAEEPSSPSPPSPPSPPQSSADLSTNVPASAQDVTVDTPVTLRVANGKLDNVMVRVQQSSQRLPGAFHNGKTRWTAQELLEPATRYVVIGHATDAAGLPTSTRVPFRTQALTLPEQTYAVITPEQDETVGVGMPVIVNFDVPVTDRAEFERHMHVTASPSVRGSWHWMSDQEVHWRPRTYWEPGTRVDVDLDVNGVDAGNGIYGQLDRTASFRIGHSVVMKADLKTDKMKVIVNGDRARTIPITGGKPGFETRSGTKLIVEKFRTKRMDAATVGIKKKDPEYYNISNVRYAQRVTFTGEFLHGAPWSTYAQGSSNVSHGCVGMSVNDAGWLFKRTHRGDPVEVTGTKRGLEPGNGWTDWDVSFAEYKQGSAL